MNFGGGQKKGWKTTWSGQYLIGQKLVSDTQVLDLEAGTVCPPPIFNFVMVAVTHMNWVSENSESLPHENELSIMSRRPVDTELQSILVVAKNGL